MLNRPTTIWFTGFWGGFNPHSNYFRSLLPECEVSPVNPDIVFYSVFGGPDDHKQYPNSLKLHWSGEARHYQVNKKDEVFLDVPLFALYIDWFGVKSWGDPNYLIPLADLFAPKIYKKKIPAANFIHNNITDLRRNAFNSLLPHLPIHSYGKGMNNMGRILEGNEKTKIDIQSDYLFTLCFENEYREGYITEKLLHALVANTIPIYYGSKEALSIFNDERIIFCPNGEITEDVISDIQNLCNYQYFRDDLLSCPIFKDGIKEYPLTHRNTILSEYDYYVKSK